MHYGEIKRLDVANGVGVRATLLVSGCTNHCENCFQPQTWDFHYGREFTDETMTELIDALRPGYVRGLTLLGGEPFEPETQRALVKVLVYAAEQLYGAGNGSEKLQYVRDELNRRGFEVDFDEIEAAVGEFLNKGIAPDYDKQIADAIASDKTPSVEDDAE